MTVALFVVLLVGILVMLAVVGWRLERHHRQLEEQLAASLVARTAALDKQHKALVRRLAATNAQAAKAVDAANGLGRQVQQVLCDPTIQRVLNDGR